MVLECPLVDSSRHTFSLPPSLSLLLEDRLCEEEGVREHDGAVDEGDGAHGQARVTPRTSHQFVVVPARREGFHYICKLTQKLG